MCVNVLERCQRCVNGALEDVLMSVFESSVYVTATFHHRHMRESQQQQGCGQLVEGLLGFLLGRLLLDVFLFQ